MDTLDAYLVAVDAHSGRLRWKVRVAEHTHGHSVSLAPLVVKDKVIIGVGGGEYGIRGFIAAYDAATGREAWRFHTIPAPGEPGSERWNRNGFFYVLDRVTGRFLLGTPFVKQNWASGLDRNGRPIQTPQPPGATTWPGQQGATNWYSPSYSPRTGLFYVSAWQDVGGVFRSQESVYKPGANFMGGGYRATPAVPDAPVPPNIRRPALNTWTDAAGHGAVIAIDPATGERK